MKKTICIFASMFLALNIFADTYTAKLKLMINSASSIAGDNIMMVEWPGKYTSGKEAGDGPKKAIEGNLQIWVPTSFGDMGTLGTDNLEGTPITVQTISDTEYTFSFSGVEGRELKLLDMEQDTLVVIKNTSVYTFTAAQNTTITGRFFIYQPVSGTPVICHRYGQLQVTDYEGDVVVKDMDGVTVLSEHVIGYKNIDLSTLASGQYQVEFNGDIFIISVNPEVTIVP